jgi:hypothetical protein
MSEPKMLRVLGISKSTYLKELAAGRGLPHVIVGCRRKYRWQDVMARIAHDTIG